MAALLLATRATPLMYYGEELACAPRNRRVKKTCRIPLGKFGWPEEKAATVNERPCSGRVYECWVQRLAAPVAARAPSASIYNVVAEAQDPKSILAFYKALAGLAAKRTGAARRTLSTIESGRYECSLFFA